MGLSENRVASKIIADAEGLLGSIFLYQEPEEVPDCLINEARMLMELNKERYNMVRKGLGDMLQKKQYPSLAGELLRDVDTCFYNLEKIAFRKEKAAA